MRLHFRSTTLALVMFAVASAAAVTPPPSGPFPVSLDGRVLFTLKAARAQYTAEQRARDISNDLLVVAADRQISADALRWIRQDTDTMLLAGRTFIMAVTDEDARLENSSRERLAGEWGQIITHSIAEY